MIRPNVHPLPQAGQPEANFVTFDEQLIARKPIVKFVRRTETEEACENAGPAWRRPEVNVDNRKLHALIHKAVQNTSMRVHIEPTMNSKDGRRAYFLLCRNLQTSHEVEMKERENMNKLRNLNWSRDTMTWTFEKYRAHHKMCYTMPNNYHREHGFQDILPRDKVNLF